MAGAHCGLSNFVDDLTFPLSLSSLHCLLHPHRHRSRHRFAVTSPPRGRHLSGLPKCFALRGMSCEATRAAEVRGGTRGTGTQGNPAQGRFLYIYIYNIYRTIRLANYWFNWKPAQGWFAYAVGEEHSFLYRSAQVTNS